MLLTDNEFVGFAQLFNRMFPGEVIYLLCIFISHRIEGPGREILQRPPVHLSVRLSVRHV